MNLVTLNQTANHYTLSIPYTLKDRAKKINQFKWDSTNKVWKYPKNISSYDSLINEFNKDIEQIKITPPKSNQESQENPFAEKNRIIAEQRKKIQYLESQVDQGECEIDRYISTIVNLNEKIDQLLNSDKDVENVIRKVAMQCAEGNDRCLRIIEDIEFDLTLPIELPKKVVNILKTITKTQCPQKDFVDLIFEGKKQKLLSQEAIALLHTIRKQRNIFAHNTVTPNSRLMRVIFLLAAFALLAEEIKLENK